MTPSQTPPVVTDNHVNKLMVPYNFYNQIFKYQGYVLNVPNHLQYQGLYFDGSLMFLFHLKCKFCWV